MTIKEHYQKNIVLAYPVVLSQLGHITVSVADSMMVGKLGAVSLASVSLAASSYSVLMLFGIGVSYGVTPLVAAADGAKNESLVTTYFKHGFIMSGFMGVLLVLLGLLSTFLFSRLGQDPEVLKEAIPYFEILVFGTFPLMFFQSFRQFAEGLSMTRQAMLISIAGNVINVGLNYVLIFGAFGITPMGVIGAGVATLISRILMALAMGVFIWKYKKFEAYRAYFYLVKFEWGILRKILKIGLPSGLQFVFEVGAFSAAAIMIGWLGPIPLAAHQVALNLSAITYMIATGVSAAASIRVGNQLGKKDYSNLRMAGMTCFTIISFLMAFFSVLFISLRNWLPSLYVQDAEAVALASYLLIIAAFFQVSDGIQSVGLGALRGLGDVKVPTLVTLLAYWVIAIPFGYVGAFVLGWDSYGIWIGLCLGLTVAAVAHMIRFRKMSAKLIKD